MPTGGLESSPTGDATSAAARLLRVVVSDAGPLISLGRLDLLGLLCELYAEVLVPEVVIEECLARPGNADTLRIRQALDAGRLAPCFPPGTALVGLGPGASAAIVHAMSLNAAMLLDERAGRQHAQALGLNVSGTLGVLVRARQQGLVGPLAPLIAAQRASGQRLGQAVVSALAAVGERAE